MCATTIAVVVDSRATAYSRIMQWLHRIGETVDSLAAWWRRSLTGRVIDRYVSRRGPLLANGLAYGLLFAFFAGVWIVVSALGLVVTGSEEMQKTLLAMLRTVIPSVSDSLFSASMLSGISHTLTWTGLVTLAVFWWTVTGWMNSLRNAVTTMFDDCTQELNVVKARLRDTVAAIMVAVLFILSTAAGVVSGGLMRLVLRALGIADDSLPGALLLESTGFATGVLLNFALFMLLLRVVAQIHAGGGGAWGSGGRGDPASGRSSVDGCVAQPDAGAVRSHHRRAHLVQLGGAGDYDLRGVHRRVPAGGGRGEPELATSAVSRQGNWHQALPDTISYETAASFIAGRKVHVFHEMCRRAYDERRVPMAIDVYGATWCGDCHRAKNALDRFGAAYTWHDIEQEEGAADRAVEISGQKHIPVVLYGDGSFQVEPSVVDIQNKLNELGLLG